MYISQYFLPSLMTSVESQRHHADVIHTMTSDVTDADSRRLRGTPLLAAEPVTMATCCSVF